MAVCNQLAQKHCSDVDKGVQECFNAYEREVVKRINDDIEAMRAELGNLLKQKESYEVNRDAEFKRLNA